MTKVILQAVATALLVVVIIIVSIRVTQSDVVRDVVASFGYIGVFLFSVLSGFSIALPVPTVAFITLFLESGFSLWPLLSVMTVGMTFGDTIGYLLGNTGRHIAEARGDSVRHGRAYRFLETFHARHRLWPFVVLAVYVSFVPAPNEILVIPMAFLGYQLRYMFPIVLIGNFVFNTLFAFGVTSLIGLF